MIEDFSFFSTLPKALDKKEQELLFYEMAKLKDEYQKTGDIDTQNKYFSIREKLITHNLRICADFAFKYCQKHNRLRDVEDIYGECTIELIRAIDDYDQSLGFSFATMAYKYMNTQILNLYINSRHDAINMQEDIQIFDKDDDEVEDGFFRFLYDDENIPENIAQKAFVEDILNYIESIENERDRLALKMYSGLDYKRKYTQTEIAKILGCSRSLISRIIAVEIQKLKNYIVSNYSLSFPNIAKGNKQVQFATDAEKEKYLFDSYFGLHGLEKKSSVELSVELGISMSSLNRIINKMLDTLNEDSKKELQLDQIKHDNKHNVKYDDEFLMSVLNDYYGLDNNPILSLDEIIKKYNINSNTLFRNIIIKAKKKLMPEEINKLNQKRKEYNDKKILDRMSLCYYMNKGLKGYEKTSQLAIEKELGINRCVVSSYIKKFQEYLDSLTPEEREELLREDITPEQ